MSGTRRPLIVELTLPRRLGTAEILAALPPDTRYPVLLEGNQSGASATWGISDLVPATRGQRWCIMAWDPFATLVSHGRQIRLEDDGGVQVWHGDPLAVLEQCLDRHSVEPVPRLPFTGGAIGYLGYELNRLLERIPATARRDISVPDLWMGFYDLVFLMELSSGQNWLCSVPLPGRSRNHQEDRLRSCLRWLTRLAQQVPPEVSPGSAEHLVLACRSNFEPDAYRSAIARAREYILAGDIFQVNLSQRWTVTLDAAHPLNLYRRLQTASPAPFAAYLHLGQYSVVSASPERFLQRHSDDRVETRPIKGTRPRRQRSLDDARSARELWESEKDAAELAMIVDLERNDLGRVCRYGTVQVPQVRRLESHPNVHHTAGVVTGRLRPDAGTAALLRATFPGGSITGAPKVRAMEIIDELEPVQRNVYTGSIGYIGFDRRLDLNIAIRTATQLENHVYFHAGGGIVADSRPEEEYQETLAKAAGLAAAFRLDLEQEAVKWTSG